MEDPYAQRLPGDEESLGMESPGPMARVADRPPASRSQSPSNLSGNGNQNFEALPGEIPNAADIAMLLDKVSRRPVMSSAAQSFSPSAAPPSHMNHSMSVPVRTTGIVRQGSKRMALPPPIDMHSVMQESHPRRKTFAAVDIHELPQRRPSSESFESSSADNNSRSGSSGSASPTAHSPTNESSNRHAKHHKSSHSSHSKLSQWDRALARSEKKKREAEMQKQELIGQSIHAAARYGDMNKLQEHLSNPDTLNQQDRAGFSPLHFAGGFACICRSLYICLVGLFTLVGLSVQH